jgi:hypothetical protein
LQTWRDTSFHVIFDSSKSASQRLEQINQETGGA